MALFGLIFAVRVSTQCNNTSGRDDGAQHRLAAARDHRGSVGRDLRHGPLYLGIRHLPSRHRHRVGVPCRKQKSIALSTYEAGAASENGVVDVYRTIPYVTIERILPAPETAETTGRSGARPDLWCGRTKSPTVDHIGTCSKCKARQARSSKCSRTVYHRLHDRYMRLRAVS